MVTVGIHCRTFGVLSETVGVLSEYCRLGVLSEYFTVYCRSILNTVGVLLETAVGLSDHGSVRTYRI